MATLGFHVLAVAVLLQAPPTSQPANEPEAAAVRAVLDTYTSACNNRDLDSIAKVFSHDPDVVLILTYTSYQCVGWENVAALYKALFAHTNQFTVRHRNIRVKVLPPGNSAYLICDQDGNGVYQGKAHSFEGVRTTWVLVKQKGQWRVVHSHWSLPAEVQQASHENSPPDERR